jgi:hypothetical protein
VTVGAHGGPHGTGLGIKSIRHLGSHVARFGVLRKKEMYGAKWNEDDNILDIERTCIAKGGKWIGKNGQECGLGLLAHFKNVRKILWPDRYWHAWTELIFSNYIENIVTILMGPGSSQKTSGASECVYIDWLARPDDTMVLVSTTTGDKLDSAVFGELKMLHEQAKNRFDWLPGVVLNAKRAIVSDDLKEKETRDMRKGIICKPCYVGHQYVGLGVYSGIKQQRIRFLADELQFFPQTFFDCLPNMFQSAGLDESGEPDIKVVGSGNPNHDPSSQLSIAAAPLGGWPSLGDVKKTTVWVTQFHRGKCVNLIGTDSPNMDTPEGQKPKYPRLISRATMKLVEKRWGKNSMQWYSQCVGKMMMNMVGNRVITKELCDNHQAFGEVVWKDDRQTNIGFLDPAWGGANADRCVWGWLQFGMDVTDREMILFREYMIVPFLPGNKEPDHQIAEFTKAQNARVGVEPENMFYDSTGRGTIGAAFAEVYGFRVPVPVAFGDMPSQRPVRHDLFVTEKDGTRRLKRCDEEYRKKVTELWFATRNVIECNQMRGLPEEVAAEGYMREYTLAPGGKIEIETKDETRERMGMSPDLYDAFCVGIEGARQRGFTIGRLGESMVENEKEEDYFQTEADEYAQAIKEKLLTR